MWPVLFSVGGYDFLSSPSVTMLSALLAFVYLRRHREYLGLDLDRLWRLAFWLIASAFAGAVVLHVAFHGLASLRPGRVSGSAHGIIWGSALAAYVFCRRHAMSFRRLADILGGMLLLAFSLKRWGCLLAGCCWGIPGSVPWALAFADPRARVRSSWLGVPLHPVSVYESLGAGLIFLAVHFGLLARVRAGRLPEGRAFLVSMAGYGALRLALDPFRGDGSPGIWGLSLSQTLSLATLLAVLSVHALWRRQP